MEKLPTYPLAMGVEQDYSAGSGSIDALQGVVSAQKLLITAQDVWAIQVSGIMQRENIKHNAVANCLNAYRVRGLIR